MVADSVSENMLKQDQQGLLSAFATNYFSLFSVLFCYTSWTKLFVVLSCDGERFHIPIIS